MLQSFNFRAHLTANVNRLQAQFGPVVTHLCKHTLMRSYDISPCFTANAIMRPSLVLIGSWPCSGAVCHPRYD